MVALAAALVLPVDGQTPDPIGSGLAKARAQWSGSRPAAYEFKLQPICGMCPPYLRGAEPHFRVREGVGRQVNGEAVELARYSTVEDQFAFIGSQIARRVVKIEVAYDPQLGYPTRAYFDPTLTASEDEFGFQVIEFRILANRTDSLPNIGLQPSAFGFVAHSQRVGAAAEAGR
jgi:hypothetical protein